VIQGGTRRRRGLSTLARLRWVDATVVVYFRSKLMSRIVLVRHGPSAHVPDARMFDHAGVERWRADYDAAGIHATDGPPTELVAQVASANHLIASDMRRAIESANRLAPGRSIQTSSLLRESPLTIPRWPTRLPLLAWAMVINAAWSVRIARGEEVSAAERARADEAADWLAGTVADGSVAVVVTHGVFRRLIAQQLRARGWTNVQRLGGYRPWSSWHLVPSTLH
jgi:broad specificity phosphatase PhoE